MAAALPPIRSRSTEPNRTAPWKGSDPTGVASVKRERRGGASVSPVLQKPDALQWQRSMGVRRGTRDQLSKRSQRKTMIDSSAGGQIQYQQARRSKGKGGRKQIEPADSYESMEIALHRNRVVRKNEGRSAKIQYSQTASHRVQENPSVQCSTSPLPGIDDEPLPELESSDVAAQSWKLENQTTYLATVRAVNEPYEDEAQKQAALRIQRYFRKVVAANLVRRPGPLALRPESRQEPLPSLDASSSLWDAVGEDSHGDFQRSSPVHRQLHGEDSSRLRFYQLYSDHLDWMDEESHTEMGLHRVLDDGWRREEVISILHQLDHSISPEDMRERCAHVGIALAVSESEDADEVRRILRENLQQHKQGVEENHGSPRAIGDGKLKSMRVATVDPSARAKRLELMSKQGSAHHQFLEECLQRGVHPLPIMLQHKQSDRDEKVMDLAHYRMGDEIAAALAAGLNKRAEHVQIETLILTDNKLSGPAEQLPGSRKKLSKQSGFLSSGAEALASIIKQNADTITHLDLSENPLGPSGCQVLAKTFANSSQALAVQTLRLNNCKLGDKGTRALLGLLSEWCPYLNSLDIGRNNLGQGGSAALAIEEILVDETVPLSTLSLNYNNFGEKHMRRFALAIPENTFLTHLDLSWNSMGCEGAMILAQSLRTNGTLQLLDVSHDQIQERGAFVLADMLKENKGLEQLVLSGNPIGQRGGRAILRAINRMVELGTADTRKVILSKCNYSYSTADKIFDPANPGGDYECDLTNPYDRAVAWELVELAWKEEGENWEDERIDNQPFDLPEPEEGEVWGRDPSFGPGCWYQLPAEGVLKVTYLQTPKVPRFEDCIDNEMVDKLIDLMSDKLINDHGTMLVTLASYDFYFTAQIACTLTILTRDTLNKVTCMSALIPRIIDPINMSSDCYDWMTVSELAALEGRAPDLFNFIPSNPTDHYKLELGRTDHRRILTRLVCICAEEKEFREKHNMEDTSQKGDGEGWRNETMTTSEALMGPPVVNDSVDWNAPLKQYQPYQPVPWDIDEQDCTGGRLKYGTLEFDFVSTNTGPRIVGQKPMSQAVFRLFLKELHSVKDMVTVVDSQQGSSKGKSKKKRTRLRTKTSSSSKSASEKTRNQLKMMRTKSLVSKVVSVFQMGKPVEFSEEDLQQLVKIQALIRGKTHRNSTQGIKLCPRSTLQKNAVRLIHAERVKFQRYSQTRTREVQKAKQAMKELAKTRSASSPKAKTTAFATVAQAAEVGSKNGNSMQRTYTLAPAGKTSAQARVQHFRSKIAPQHRPCWWTPSQEKQVSARSKEAAKGMVRDKQLQMLRRSTMQYFFSSQQVRVILEAIDAGPHKKAHVEALVILFAVILDLERVNFPQVLGHTTYDRDGNHFVDWDELKELRKERNPWVVLESRLGPANLFNPILPEREYALDLRQHDCKLVAQCLVVLSAEPGENLKYTSYNGLPFDVGAKWLDEVPDLGMFCGEFVTPPACALMSLRLAMARRLLMPGFGRWRAVPFRLRNPDEDWRAQEASIGLEHCVIDADGSLIERSKDEEDVESLSLGGLLGALRFKSKLKKAASKRLQQHKYRKLDMSAAAPLSVIVKLSLAAQRAQQKAAATAKNKKKNVASSKSDGKDFETLKALIEGETVEQGDLPPMQAHEKIDLSLQEPALGGLPPVADDSQPLSSSATGIADAFTSALITRPGGLVRFEDETEMRASIGLARIDH